MTQSSWYFLLNLYPVSSFLRTAKISAWRKWFDEHGLEVDATKGAVFEDANVAMQAALFGQGVMLGYVEFIQDDLRAGRLIQPLDDLVAVSEAYHLIIADSAPSEAVSAVAEWLIAQARVE